MTAFDGADEAWVTDEHEPPDARVMWLVVVVCGLAFLLAAAGVFS